MAEVKSNTNGDARSVLARLTAADAVLTLGVRYARSGDVARIARGAGYNSLWIDLEHSSMSVDCAVQIAATTRDLDMEAWVRVPEREYGIIGRLLDGGAGGIIVPRIETADQAKLACTASRFPPIGQRSQIALLPQFSFQRMPPLELMRRTDASTTLQVLLESGRGIENADDIASINGVDILGIGMNDLSADLGCVGDMRNPKLRDACAHVLAAAKRHGKIAVVGGVADVDQFQELVTSGFAPLIFAGIDTDVFASSLGQRADEWRDRLKQQNHRKTFLYQGKNSD